MNKNPANPLTEEEIEELRKKKQLFLRSEIMELGYDPISFQNYMDDLKNGGLFNMYQINYKFDRRIKR